MHFRANRLLAFLTVFPALTSLLYEARVYASTNRKHRPDVYKQCNIKSLFSARCRGNEMQKKEEKERACTGKTDQMYMHQREIERGSNRMSSYKQSL